MVEKIARAGVKKEAGYLYFVDKKGNVARRKMANPNQKKGAMGNPEVVKKIGVKKERGYLYFIDKKGDVARAKLVSEPPRKNKNEEKLKHRERIAENIQSSGTKPVSKDTLNKVNEFIKNLEPYMDEGLLVHFYGRDSMNDTSKYFKQNLKESNNRGWELRGTDGHGVRYDRQRSPVKLVNFFQINGVFKNALGELIHSPNENHIDRFQHFVAFSRKGIAEQFPENKIINVECSYRKPSSINECHYIDKPRERRYTLDPFHYCLVVRLETGDAPIYVSYKNIIAIGTSEYPKKEIVEAMKTKNREDICIFTY